MTISTGFYLASEHGSKLFTDSLEELLDGGGVANECGGHLQTSWRNVADGGLDVVWDPRQENYFVELNPNSKV